MDLLKKFGEKGMNVSFVGAGNLAWHLAPALDNTDFAVREVFSQHKKNAAALADRLYQADVKKDLDFSESKSRIFIVAVSDDVIEEVVRAIELPPGAILVHTSGSQPLSMLGSAGTLNTGVLYPLQTFSKEKKVDFKEVPFFIESENLETEKVLMAMAKEISKKVYKSSSEKRRALHVAAVFASNFTNHMLTLSEQLLDEHGMDLELLKPLIVETINKSLSIGPEKAQTGPAARGDVEVLDKHYEFLKNNERLAEIYKVISQHILDQYLDDE
jgi:predicted short-subunit dehydrogenase-like oxidoreductase (DUF2520 family)